MPFLIQQARIEKRIHEEATRLLEEKRVQEIQREKQQGLGRPIISVVHQGYRFVAVGSRLYHSKQWKTFEDFLGDYLKMTIGGEWGNAELVKPFEERHPIIQWYHHVCMMQRKHAQPTGEIFSAPMTGAVAAYYGLAYNLYLIAHNIQDIETRLIARLKNPSSFQGAYYETRVAAELVKAGFELSYEDETDTSTTHCEFTATFSRSQRSFSVEAKSRPPSSRNVDGKELRVGRQLYGALDKRAKFDRVVFIDINRPAGTTKEEAGRLIDRAVKLIKRFERTKISGQPAPPAYVLLTNYPDQYCLDDVQMLSVVAFIGFRIPDYGEGATFGSIRAAVRARERHIEMFELKQSMAEHAVWPSTFDGQMPFLAFGKSKTPRLVIGQRYVVPDASGRDVHGVLIDAVVNRERGEVTGVYRVDGGRSILATSPLTPEELEAYRQFPDTFFGVYRKKGQRAENALDLFDFFYECYKGTTKARLLELLRDAPDIRELEELSQKDLVEVACERWAYAAMRDAQIKDAK